MAELSTATAASTLAGTERIPVLQSGNFRFTTQTQILEGNLAALKANSTQGLWAHTGAGTGAARTITGTANEITATNGNGASGNPTLSLPTAITLTGKTVTGGVFTGLASFATANDLSSIVMLGRYGAVLTESYIDTQAGSTGINMRIGGATVMQLASTGVNVTGTIKSSSYTVATLPSAATAGAGARAFVTNATVTTFASTVAGGGANQVPVFSDGTNWKIG